MNFQKNIIQKKQLIDYLNSKYNKEGVLSDTSVICKEVPNENNATSNSSYLKIGLLFILGLLF